MEMVDSSLRENPQDFRGNLCQSLRHCEIFVENRGNLKNKEWIASFVSLTRNDGKVWLDCFDSALPNLAMTRWVWIDSAINCLAMTIFIFFNPKNHIIALFLIKNL